MILCNGPLRAVTIYIYIHIRIYIRIYIYIHIPSRSGRGIQGRGETCLVSCRFYFPISSSGISMMQ